jgi:hypothetical protein
LKIHREIKAQTNGFTRIQIPNKRFTKVITSFGKHENMWAGGGGSFSGSSGFKAIDALR